MSDDPIRTMLRDLAGTQGSSMIPTTPAHVAILRSRVEAAGGDPEAVREWVQRHDGYVDRTPPIERDRLGPRRTRSSSDIPGEEYYAVKRDALGL